MSDPSPETATPPRFDDSQSAEPAAEPRAGDGGTTRSSRQHNSSRWLTAGVIGLTLIVAAVMSWRTTAVQAWYVSTRAQSLLDAGQPAEAGNLLQNSGLVGQDRGVTLLMIQTLRQQGRLQQALQAVQNHSLLIDDSVRQRQEKLLIHARAGHLQEAESELPQLLSSDSLDERDVCEAFVIGYRLNYRFPEARQLLDAWGSDAPQDHRVPAHRGVILQMLTEWEQAAQQFRRAIRLGDSRATTQLRLGECLLQLNDAEQARVAFKAASQADPTRVSAWLGLAKSSQQLGDDTAARQAYLQCLQLDPKLFEAQLAVAEADAAAGRLKPARQRLQDLLQRWPQDARTLYAYAQVLLQQGQQDQAAAVLQQWESADQAVVKMESLLNELRTQPQNAELRSRIGVLMMQHYSRSMGRQYLESVLQSNPGDESARQLLVRYFEDRNQPQQAEKYRVSQHQSSKQNQSSNRTKQPE